MKYIRIKNGLYNTEEAGSIEIISQSDTIEELCDEFVVIDHETLSMPFIIYRQNIKKFYQKNKNTCEIYGAIWTDEGLIYVAKMNSEGVLELI